MENYYALSGFIPNLYSLHAHSASLWSEEESFHSSAVRGLVPNPVFHRNEYLLDGNPSWEDYGAEADKKIK